MDTFRAILVNHADLYDEIGELPIKDGSLSFAYYSENKASGTVRVTGNPGANLVRIVCDRVNPGESERIVLGTFFAKFDKVSSAFGLDEYDLTLESTLTRLSGDYCPSAVSYPAGTAAWGEVLAIMSDCMEPVSDSRLTAAQKSATTSQAMSFDVGTSWLTIANNLCSAIGCASLSVDPYGVAYTEPYIAPSDREASYVFGSENCVYAAGITTTTTEGGIPNRVVVTADIDGETYSAVRDLAAGSPYSADSVGRRVTEVYQATDIESASALNAKADQYFAAIASYVDSQTIAHHYAPVSVGDVVLLSYYDGGSSSNSVCMVQNMDISLVPGLPTETKMSVIKWVIVDG